MRILLGIISLTFFFLASGVLAVLYNENYSVFGYLVSGSWLLKEFGVLVPSYSIGSKLN